MGRFIIPIFLIIIFVGCNNSTEPNNDVPSVDSLRLVLKADKATGDSPLTVNFTGEIKGNAEGISGNVPDYFFFNQYGKTVIVYGLPDTTQILNRYWSEEITYPSGEYNVVLLYRGKRDNQLLELWSDTVHIRVN